MHALTGRLGASRRACGFEPRGLPLALGRSALALATLTVILFCPDDGLFAYTPAYPDGVRCAGVAGLSLWCVMGAHGWALHLDRTLALAVLAVTASGWRPRWTCVPHWYVSFSLAESMTLPNGGEIVAQIATLLLIPVCLADRGRWQWHRPSTPLPATWRGAAYAAVLTVRAQAAIIYTVAAVSKLREPAWRRGTAMYAVLHDPAYGLPAGVLRHAGAVAGSVPFIAVLTWTVPLVETAIAIAVLGTGRARRLGLVLVVLLHGAIILTMGLVSFGLIMIGLVLVVCSGDEEGIGRAA